MSTLDKLYEKLKEAEFDVSRAKARLATNEQRFRMGLGADRSVLFSDNLRLECAITEVARTERIIASFKHKKADAKADAKSDDEKALDMIKALIGHLTAEGKTWKVVRRDDAVRSLKIAQAAIEGIKLATSK